MTCFQELGASHLPQHGPDIEPSASVKSTPGASESCESTGQMSLFGEMCGGLPLRTFFPTPCSQDGSRDGRAVRSDTNMFEGGSHSVQLHHLAAHGFLTSSPQGTPASHSHSPGSAWARRMTATYGRKLGDWSLSSDRLDACLKTLLGTSIWGSMTCYLTWRRSATPAGRLLFRLVPSTPRTAGIGSGFWGTPTSRDWKDGSSVENVPENGLLGRQVVNDARMWPTPRASENENRTTKPAPSHGNGHGKVLAGEVGQANGLKLNAAWVSRMMGFPDDWLTLDGEGIR